MSLVRIFGSPPRDGATRTSGRPSGSPWNASSSPLGDQRGNPGLELKASVVSWLAEPPSGSATQICTSPERSDRKATLRPSGERLARKSALVEAIADAAGERAGAPGA